MAIDIRDTQEQLESVDVSQDTKTDKPSFMTAEEFNRASTQRERAFEKRLQKQQEDFNKILERLAPEKKEEPQLSRLAELEKQNRELSKRMQDRDVAERTDNLRRSTERALREHGIDSEFSEHALAYLIDAKKLIKHDEDGRIVMTLNGMTYDDLSEGIAAWSQSRDAKLYKKPTGAIGSGDTNRRSSAQDNTRSTMLKSKPDWDKHFDAKNPKSGLDHASKIALSQFLGENLMKNR